MAIRLHVGTTESLTRSGGLHNYIRALTAGQRQLGLDTFVADRVGPRGSFQLTRDGYAGGMPELEEEDCIHFHFAQSARHVNRVFRRTKAKRIFHFHGPWAAEGRVQGDWRGKQLAKYLLERDQYRRHDRMIVASDAFGRILSDQYRIPRARIRTVYPGVDTNRFSPGDMREARIRLGLDLSRPIVACVRRLEPRMGIPNALKVAAATPDVQLVVAGVGSLRGDLESLASSLGIESRVRFMGRVPDSDLPDLYRAANATLVPTVALEGFGLIVMESMACGTPVIATRVGGLPEAMGPYSERWCVEDSSNTGQLRALLTSLLAGDRPEASELRKFAESRSLRAMALNVEAILAEGLAR